MMYYAYEKTILYVYIYIPDGRKNSPSLYILCMVITEHTDYTHKQYLVNGVITVSFVFSDQLCNNL